MNYVGRRFQSHNPAGNPWVLSPNHTAVIEGRTRYPATRKSALDVRRVLKSGKESRKIGDRIVKGKWAGFPIFTLTLEERATCPRSCKEWLSCYGNKMHWSHRFAPDAMTMAAIALELGVHQLRHPNGFAVRLHVLGDFASVAYVAYWGDFLERFPALHLFGYTAHAPDSEIGTAIRNLSWGRAAIRFSGTNGARGTVVIETENEAPTQAIVCPAQTNRTDCCGTCALCWQTERAIAFLRH